MRTSDSASTPENGGGALSLSNGAKGIGSEAEANGAGPLFCCPDCAYKTTSLRKLGRHRSVNHAGVKYRCEHCDFVTGYQSNYYRHRKQVHNGGMSQSALQAVATNSPSLQPPNRQTGSNSFRGAQMQTPTSDFGMSDEHQQRLLAAAIMASSAAQFRCDRCQFQAASPEQLAAHISLLHGSDGQRTCGECGVTMTTKSQWQEHLRTYHSHRNQAMFSKTDFANIFSSLANNGAAALTAAHLIMAAAANGSSGAGYDLNLLASAAALTATDNLLHQQQSRSPDHAKSLDFSTSAILESDGDKDKSCQRYYACVYDCDFAVRSSRQYLHHLRDEHGERFAIFYCDQCDDYATKFVARLRSHKALVHDGNGSLLIENGTEKRIKEENGSSESIGTNSQGTDGGINPDDDDMEERKLSIVVDQQHEEANGDESEQPESNGFGEDEIDGVFRCAHCPYSTNELPRFKKHAKCHETTVDTRCQFCNFRTVYSWNLDRHVRCHRQSGKYTCRRCSFSQNTRQSMQFHLQHHHDDVRFECAETQTDDESDDWEPNVNVGSETFIFEEHAVRMNAGFELEAEKGNTNLDKENGDSGGGFAESTPISMTNGRSPFDQSQHSDSGRHSTPTPPALLTNGVSSILQQNRRHQVFHNRMHYKRRQQQQIRQLLHSPVMNAEERRKRKFLSEQEAIEIPSDASGNEFDNDPDIKNRHCSICGYQGKWISEMIRHKRVHTNERPFKCKYCSRTSKWKADLIRHVAKVHGYRVVSKYSRSKTFDDADQTALRAMKEAVQSSTPQEFSGLIKTGSSTTPSTVEKRCQPVNLDRKNFDDSEISYDDGEEGLDLSTNMSTDDRKMNSSHWFTNEQPKENGQRKVPEAVAVVSQSNSDQRASAEAAALMFRQLCGAVQLNDSAVSNGSSSPASSVLSSGALSVAKEVRDVISSKQLSGSLEKYVMIKQADGGEPILKCRVCPYETKDLHTFRAHTQKHENKKPYLCSTCGYRSNWSSDVHKHIRLKKTGHEAAYVIKLNESDLPAMSDSSPVTPGRSSSNNSDCSSGEFGMNSVGEVQNGSTISTTLSPALDGRNAGQVTWRCLKCHFEDESSSVITEHLHLIHQTPPFACRHCDFGSLHRKTCIYHVQSQHNSRDSSIMENLICEYRPKPAKTPVDSPLSLVGEKQSFLSPNVVVGEDSSIQPFKRTKECQEQISRQVPKVTDVNETAANEARFDQATMAMMAANAAAAAFAASAFNGGNGQARSMEWLQLAQLCLLGGFPMNANAMFGLEAMKQEELSDGNGQTASSTSEKAYNCDKCPFVGRTESDFVLHERGHRAPNKGLMCYKCVFCEWYAPKKTSIFEHLKLHTDQPAIYQAEVERNMITPLSRKRSADDSAESAAANALLGLAKAETTQNGDSMCVKMENGKSGLGNGATALDGKRRKLNFVDSTSTLGQRHGDSALLGGSDVDDVMSDFNAIIHAADQDLAQESINGANGRFAFDGTTPGDLSHSGKHAYASSILAASEKLWIRKMVNGSQKTEDSAGLLGQCDGIADAADVKMLDREAYIHAGEDAFDSISGLGANVKGEIQKVTAVVDGQVRKMWQCRHCPHMSKRRANVRMHEKKHFKSSAIGVFKCPKCNYRGDKRSLHVHYRVHMSSENGGTATMPELFQCTSCPAIFQSQEDLALHLINHEGGSSKAYRCTRCSYAVASSSALQKHARVHDRQSVTTESTAATPTEDRCLKRQMSANRRYGSSAAIANVIVQHEEINSLTDSDDRNEMALNLVTRQSNGTKSETTSRTSSSVQSTPSPTMVDVSGGASAFAASLLQPLVKPKKYLCTKCPAKFADRTQLNRHVQFHGVKLKFKCYLCDYSVPFPINLTKHLKSHHSVDIGDASATVSVSDNENESEIAVSTGENGDFDEASVSSEYEDESGEDKDPTEVIEDAGLEPGSLVASPTDGGLKIKISLGPLK